MAEGLHNALVSRNSASTKHPIEKYSPGPIVWHYLCDSTYSRDRHTITHRQTDGRTDTRRRHVPRLV